MLDEKQKSSLEAIQKELTVPATLEVEDGNVVVIVNGISYTTEFTIDELPTIINKKVFEPKKVAKALLHIASRMQSALIRDSNAQEAQQEREYSIEEIKAYASHWLKSGLSTDGKDSIPDNIRLSAFIHYIDADDRDNIDNFLKRHKSQ